MHARARADDPAIVRRHPCHSVVLASSRVRPIAPIALCALLAACEQGVVEQTLDTPDAVMSDITVDAVVDNGPCAPCSVWQVRCGNRCVDLTSSPENCGACGVRCDLRTQICRSGVCMNVASRCASLTPDAGPDAGPDATADVAPADAPDDVAVETGGFRAEYYARTDLTRLRLVRVDRRVDFDWSMSAPSPMIPREAFSARWTAILRPRTSEEHTFITETDDGVRLWVDDELLIDDWNTHGTMENRATIRLAAGADYVLRMEYFNGAGAGVSRLSWSTPTMMRERVPPSVLSPVSGVDFGCEEGVCCPSGGGVPVCCPAGTRCVQNSRFRGCCPADEPCGEDPQCSVIP